MDSSLYKQQMSEYSFEQNAEMNWLQEYGIMDLCRCIIRQFMIQNNFPQTLQTFEHEDKELKKKISKSVLIKILSMNNLVYFNKQSEKPFKSLLEVLVHYLKNKFEAKLKNQIKSQTTSIKPTHNQIHFQTNQQTERTQNIVEEKTFVIEPPFKEIKKNQSQKAFPKTDIQKFQPPPKQNQSQKQPFEAVREKRESLKKEKQQKVKEEKKQLKKDEENSKERSRMGGMRKLGKGKMADKQFFQENIKSETIETKKEEIQEDLSKKEGKLKDEEEKNIKKDKDEKQQKNEPKMVKMFGKKKKNENENQQHTTKFAFDENFIDKPLGNNLKYEYEPLQIHKITIENEPQQLQFNYFQKIHSNFASKKRPEKTFNPEQVQSLKKALFQNNSPVLPKSWNQGFILSPFQETPYGLQQIEGGPCGIIAAIQCYYLKHLLHLSKPPSEQSLRNQTLRQNCLVGAFVDILMKVKSSDKIILAIPPSVSFSGAKVDYSSLKMVVIEGTDFGKVFENLWQYRNYFIGKTNHGVSFLLFSIVMTKGAQLISNEMDCSENPLIGNHGHCTQQLVNLFISGKASSNLFDGEKVLDSEMKLKGISEKGEFGFLTIFETLKYVEVGKNLKNPVYPFWIICKEFHYHVIFANHYLIGQLNDCEKFDIMFFDGLYNCKDRIRLTCEKYTFGEEEKKVKDLALIEQVMMTKWGGRKVDWNGSIKIL